MRKPHFKKQITENVSAVATIRYDENQSAAGVAVYAEPKPKQKRRYDQSHNDNQKEEFTGFYNQIHYFADNRLQSSGGVEMEVLQNAREIRNISPPIQA